MFAQHTDVSKLIKRYYGDVNGVDFYGASLEENGNLHISLGYDSGFIITGENDGYSVKDIIFYINLNSIFKPARNIFKKIPNAKSIKVYFVSFEDVRDDYGNLLRKDKKIKCEMELTREKASLLNWTHIEELLITSWGGIGNDELIHYLDNVK